MTANKAYKIYKNGGGTLSFAEFIDREKKKNFLNFEGEKNVLTNKPLSDSINQTLANIHKQSGYKDEIEGTYIFGIHKNVLIAAGLVTAITVAYLIYKNNTK